MATTIKINRKGVRALLSEPGVAKDIARRARAISNAAGPGMRVETGEPGVRARAAVITDTNEAVRAEASHRALTRALDAGR